MPFTPFHLGPGILIGILLQKHLDLPTLLVASVALDLEPLFVMITGAGCPLHGLFHTFLGGSIAAVAISIVMWRISGFTGNVAKAFGISQEPSFRAVAAASFLGVYLHILLDAPLYGDMEPFFPLDSNPLFFPQLSGAIFDACVAALILGIAAYAAKIHSSGHASKLR